MQLSPSLLASMFNIWWLILNGFVYFVEYDLLLRLTDAQRHRSIHLFLYIEVNCVLTFLVLYYHISGILPELLHTLFLCFFPLFFLKLKMHDVIAPIAIIFTLSAFREGALAVIMRALAA